MRSLIAVGLLFYVAVLTGCTVLDSIFGVTPEGEATPGGGVVGTAGGILKYFIPGIDTALAAAAGLYAAVRGKRWKDAALSTFDVIERGAEVSKSVEALKPELAAAHSAKGIAGFVKKALDKMKPAPVENKV